MTPDSKWYLKAAHAPDFESAPDRRLYRFFEILPGALVWATLAGTVLASCLPPVGASFFFISFCIYWLLKTVFLSLHLRYSFSTMQENLKKNWRTELDHIAAYPAELCLTHWSQVMHLV